MRSALVGIVATIGLLLAPTTSAQAQPITEIPSVKVARGGYWVTATDWPSKYGDLASIAGTVYGNRGLWPKIYQANRSRIKNPNLIRVGQRIYVPVLNSTRTTNKASRSATRTNPTARWVHPLPVRVSSCYGPRWGSMHRGIDYDGNYGDPIRAVGSGTVKKSGWWAGGYGYSVLIHHSGSTYTHYGHMSKVLVRSGQRIKAGQIIGRVGATGHATGAHLHFEVWRGMWGQIDPRGWLRSHGLRPGC